MHKRLIKRLISAALASALMIAGTAVAQPPGGAARVVEQVEAVVTVTEVDPEARTVTFQGPRGETTTVSVPQAQNLDKVKPGSRFKVVYTEAAALGIKKEAGEASASTGTTVERVAKGAGPGGGIKSRTIEVTGTVEKIDQKNRYVSVRGPKGRTVTAKVPDDVKDFEKLSVGDRITLTYTQAIAANMIPEPA